MAEQLTFPQSGDNDDAEHFGMMIGRDNAANYVEQGLGLSTDYTVPEVSVGTGKAYVMVSSDIASTSGDTVLKVNHAVQVPNQTVTLTDSAVNYVYLEPNLGTDDSGAVNAYTTQQSGDILLIGVIDTSADTTETRNRAPEIDVNSLLLREDMTDGTNTVYDGANQWVPQTRLENDSLTVSAGDGLKNGGLVSLGGSTTVDIEPVDFAGTYLSDDGADNLQVNLGTGLQGDGTDNITLTNDSVTVTSGDGLKNGGLVSLGGSITIDIEPVDFAGAYLSDDGTDNLQVNLGTGLQGDGSDGITLTNDYVLTSGDDITGALNFSTSANIQDAGLDVIQFDGAQNVTMPNGNLTVAGEITEQNSI